MLKNIAVKIDNGSKRSGGDRRVFSYAVHIPERRSGTDRRCGYNLKSARYRKESDTEFRRRIE